MIVKIIATLFAIYAWSKVFGRYRKHSASIQELLLWTFVWVGIVAVVFVPNKTNLLAHLIGMGRGFDALVFVCMLGVFYALYKVTAKLKQVETELTQLVSELALAGAKTQSPEQD